MKGEYKCLQQGCDFKIDSLDWPEDDDGRLYSLLRLSPLPLLPGKTLKYYRFETGRRRKIDHTFFQIYLHHSQTQNFGGINENGEKVTIQGHIPGKFTSQKHKIEKHTLFSENTVHIE